MNILLAILVSCASYDIETLPSLRTQQYSAEPYKKVVVFSAPRTGSSVVYNIFRFLFETEGALSHAHNEFHSDCSVLKTHKRSDVESLTEENVLYVIPIRNPLDSSLSNYRICPQHISDKGGFFARLAEQYRDHLALCERLQQSGRDVVFIKYEDFGSNLDYILDFVERHFSLKITDKDRALIQNGYGRENVQAAIAALQDFNQYLPLSGFHGKHVSLEKFTVTAGLRYWLKRHYEEVAPLFRKYGYFEEEKSG